MTINMSINLLTFFICYLTSVTALGGVRPMPPNFTADVAVASDLSLHLSNFHVTGVVALAPSTCTPGTGGCCRVDAGVWYGAQYIASSYTCRTESAITSLSNDAVEGWMNRNISTLLPTNKQQRVWDRDFIYLNIPYISPAGWHFGARLYATLVPQPEPARCTLTLPPTISFHFADIGTQNRNIDATVSCTGVNPTNVRLTHISDPITTPTRGLTVTSHLAHNEIVVPGGGGVDPGITITAKRLSSALPGRYETLFIYQLEIP
jgi:hypothetical protein